MPTSDTSAAARAPLPLAWGSIAALSGALPSVSTAAADELAIGAQAPEFTLVGTDGKKHSLAEYAAKAKVVAVVFPCNHCPWAKAYEPVLLDLAKQYTARGVAFVL